MSKPDYWDKACRSLSRRDPVLRGIIGRVGALHLVPRGDPFATLARSIVGQQISVKAAQAVWARFETACGDMTPVQVYKLPVEIARGAGLSLRKVEYVQDLAARFITGDVDPTDWPALDDEAIIGQLVAVRGIGRWTAEMFLMFNLLRPDVFPVDDLGLMKALGIAYGDGGKFTRAQAVEMSDAWRPWRTVATWYFWRSLDLVPVEQ